MTTLYFINALSRIGLSHQLDTPRNSTLSSNIWPHPIADDSFFGSTELYDYRDPSNTFTRARYQHFKYGTAWALADTGQYLSITLLGIHAVLALIYTIVLFRTKRSSAAWDSLNELIVLAYNSMARPGAFKNYSSGIEHSRTLEKNVRVGTWTLDDGSVQAELVVCDDEGGAGNVVAGKAYS